MISDHKKNWFVSGFLIIVIYISFRTLNDFQTKKQNNSNLDTTVIQRDNDNLKKDIKKLHDEISSYVENGTVVDLTPFKKNTLPESFFESKFYENTQFLKSDHYLFFFLMTISLLSFLVFFLQKLKVTESNREKFRQNFLGITGVILLISLIYYSIVD